MPDISHLRVAIPKTLRAAMEMCEIEIFVQWLW
jgi:hypothetical protein